MQIFQTLDHIPGDKKGAVIAIGNFDGVHRGHQKLLDIARNKAKELKKPFGILTFEPHPRRLFRPDEPPGRITPAPLKAQRLEIEGVDVLYTLAFDWDFASQSPEAFIQNVLHDGIQPAHIVIGYDFCFGQLRKGSPQTMMDSGYGVTVIEKVTDNGEMALSSSRIRQCLREGLIDEANALLGWDWEMQGVVVKGDQRGRELGYPTANIPLDDCIHPAYGVYATWVQIEGEEEWRPSATNIGIRPMFEIPTAQIESYIFDFDRDIYGKMLRIKPVRRLRGEAKFDSLDDLITQMAKDCDQARGILEG